VRLLADPSSEVLTGLVNSTVIALSVALIASLVGLSAGRALGLHSFRGKRAGAVPAARAGHRAGHRRHARHPGLLHPYGLSDTRVAWCWCTCWRRCRTSRS
jgi:hypothetical protein